MRLLKNLKDAIQGKAKLGQLRSPEWPKVRAEHLKSFPTCAVCGGNKKINVHHIKSYVEHPELELNKDNLITLCEGFPFFNHHRLVGHLGNFQQINPDVVKDAAIVRKKLIEAAQEKEERKKKK